MSEPTYTDADFAWVDGYFAEVGRHYEVRMEDELLILMPNRVYKLNPSGLAILRHLKAGRGIEAVLNLAGADARRRAELYWFLCDFRSLM